MSCPYDCPSTCGLEAEIEDGRLIKVKNDKTHPVSKNGICRKMQHYEQDIYSADRLRTPLRRVGRKGEAKFEPISWDEAVREITDQFKAIIEKWGAEAILPCVYSGVMSDIQRNCGDAFFNRMGASELVKTLCSSAKGAGYDAVVGKTGCLEPTELNDSDLYLIWSCNMAATRLQTLADLQKPANRHKKKILIDVYPNPTAAYCDQVITIKAGTDGALALSMMHVLKNEHLVDKSFVEKYTSGYPAFAETLDVYTPEWAESEPGIPAEVIRQLAREFGQAKAPAIILGSGNSRHGNGGMTVRLITILSALTGAWQHPGGGLCGCTPIDTDYVNKSLITRPDFRKKPARKININQIGQALAMDSHICPKRYCYKKFQIRFYILRYIYSQWIFFFRQRLLFDILIYFFNIPFRIIPFVLALIENFIFQGIAIANGNIFELAIDFGMVISPNNNRINFKRIVKIS